MRLPIYFLALCLLVSSCSKKDDTTPDQNQLIITSFSPMEAFVGDEIVFIGENIDVSTEYSIFFNGVAATTVQNFPTELRAIVPQGASTGNITISYEETSLDVGSLTILETTELIITSFSPMEAFVGEAVTFIGENIDLEIPYTVSFNGLEGETTSVTETEIVSIIPEGATSGEVKISYEDLTVSVGTIEILELIIDLDGLYAYLPVAGAGCQALEIYSMDMDNGILIDEIALLQAYSCYMEGPSNFYRGANIFVHTYWEYLAQGLDPAKQAVIKDFNTGATFNWHLDNGSDYTMSILAAHENKIYYSYRNFVDIDEAYELRVANLNFSDRHTIYQFPLDYTYNLENSGFLPSTKKLVFFTKNEVDQTLFFKVNVETSTLTSYNIPDSYSSIFITVTERIFGVKSLGGNEHEIVEIDKTSGNILSSLAIIPASEIEKIDYSVSSNRIFALTKDATSYRQYLYKLNLDNGSVDSILLDEQSEYPNLYGIYLNN